jgi:hypothetical protein
MKWITLVSFIIALASMPATAQKPHLLKGVKLGKSIFSSVDKFDSDRSDITDEWVDQQMLLVVKANKVPISSDVNFGTLYAKVRIIEVKNNSGAVFAYAWTLDMQYHSLSLIEPLMRRIHWKVNGSYGISPNKADLKTALRDQIRDQVDEFCAAYYTAN